MPEKSTLINSELFKYIRIIELRDLECKFFYFVCLNCLESTGEFSEME